MKTIAIATLMERGKMIGIRLFDIDSKKMTDAPVDNIKKILSNPDTAELIMNVRLINGSLQGINGKLDRYAKLNRQGRPIESKSPLVIINKIGEDGVGYTVVDYKGMVKKFKTEDVVRYANEFGIANGKVCTQDNIEYISAIQGAYEVEKVAQSKVKNGSNLGPAISIPMNLKDASSVARNASKDIETNINYNDVFLAMTSDQKKVLKQYYTWYTVEVYKGLAKSTRLDLAPGKAEKLAELRGIKDWKFGGVWDTGFHGGGKCELGHSLRYEYYAVPEDEAERLQMNLASKNNYRRMNNVKHNILDDDDTFKIIFGETCASDFFNIEPDQMKKLVKTREIMSNEIKLMADILTNGLQKEYMQKCKMLYECLSRLDSRQNIVEVFGLQIGSTLVNFINTSMPFPMSLVIEAGKQIRADKVKAFNKIFKTRMFDSIYNGTNSYYNQNARRLFDYVADYAIEGDYMYDPYDKDKKRRDIGKYNKETRYARDVLLRRLRTGCRINAVDMQKLDSFLFSFKIMMDLRGELKKFYIMHNDKIGSSNFDGFKDYLEKVGNKVENQDDLDILNICYTAIDLTNISGVFPKRIPVVLRTNNDRPLRRYSAYSNYYDGINDCADTLHKVVDKYSYSDICDKLLVIIDSYENARLAEEKARIDEENRIRDMQVPSVNYLLVYVNDDKVYLMANKEEGIQIYRHQRGAEYEDIVLKTENYSDIKVSDISAFHDLSKVNWEQKVKELKQEADKEKKEEVEKPDNKKESEKDKKEIPDDKLMEHLAKLIKQVDDGKLPSSYGTEICKDILNRGVSVDKLSYKQKWRVKHTIEELEEASSKLDKQLNNKEEAVNNSVNESIKEKTDENVDENIDENVAKAIKLVNYCNSSKENKDKIYEADALALKIALTVKRLGRCSDKQLKHIEEALKIIEK